MKNRVLVLVSLVLLAVASTASAQLRQGTVELNPYAGYLFGGEVFHGNGYGYYYSTVNVKDDLTYGGRIGWNATSLFELEFQYSHTATTLQNGQVFTSFTSLASGLPYIKSGRVKAIAVSGEKRSSMLTGVPTWVIPEGTVTTTRGCTMLRRWWVLRMK